MNFPPGSRRPTLKHCTGCRGPLGDEAHYLRVNPKVGIAFDAFHARISCKTALYYAEKHDREHGFETSRLHVHLCGKGAASDADCLAGCFSPEGRN